MSDNKESDLGIYYDDKGNISINETIFAKHLYKKFKIVNTTTGIFYFYKDKVWKKTSDDEVRRIFCNYFNELTDDGWSLAFESRYMTALKRICPYSDTLESGENYINLQNKLFCISGDWRLQKHTSKIFTTTQLPIKFNKNSECPKFMDFLSDIFEGDQILIELIQEIFGYCLCSCMCVQQFFIFYGTGANGKSLLCEVLEALVGSENTSHVSLDKFSNSFELASIVDKKLNISTESASVNLSTNMLKQITAGESIQINPKFATPFSAKPTIKLVFSTNELPYTTDTSYGFRRRIIIIPFAKTYSHEPKDGEGKLDPYLKEKLLKELDGILNFALKGLRRLIDNNYKFSRSEAVNETLATYFASINPYVDFVKSNLTSDPQSHVVKTELYHKFVDWASISGFKRFSNITRVAFYNKFENYLRTSGFSFSVGKIHGGTRVYRGIKLIKGGVSFAGESL